MDVREEWKDTKSFRLLLWFGPENLKYWAKFSALKEIRYDRKRPSNDEGMNPERTTNLG